MAVLHFEYKMEITYAESVGKCCFTIKCIPRDDARQHLLGITLSVLPKTAYSMGEDAFGNRQIYGCETEPHDRFVFQTVGDVEILSTDYEEPEDGVTGMYRVPHGKCIPGPGLMEYYRSYDLSGYQSAYEISEAWMHKLHRDFSYVPGATQVHTAAEEAWGMGKGVCQDYAHIYAALLRMAGIPARYVCGMIVGEGASHAWVEALCGDRWVAFDPTNDCLVSDQHIKLGHGRDAADCAINRGLMWNGGAQSQKITVLVEKK
ncbi:MAG: transglutaminase family protein [bacterium]|nr:transglutaminase family protein [bacterium]